MFSRIFKAFKRAFVFILILAGIASLIMTIINLRSFFKKRDVVSVIIDSGAGNKTDAMLAVYRAVIAPELSVKAILTGIPEKNLVLNEANFNKSDTLLNLAGKSIIPILKGASESFYPKEGSKPELTEASQFIIQEAGKLKKDDKLNVVCLGPLTNIANTIFNEPSVASHLRVYFMGGKYNVRSDIWNKNEANVRGDLDAFDFLLDTHNLEIIILPANVAGNFILPESDAFALMQGKGKIWQLLLSNWRNEVAGNNGMDLNKTALIEAIINPQYVKAKTVLTPPENSRRQVSIYSYINSNQMLISFERAIKKEIETANP